MMRRLKRVGIIATLGLLPVVGFMYLAQSDGSLESREITDPSAFIDKGGHENINGLTKKLLKERPRP